MATQNVVPFSNESVCDNVGQLYARSLMKDKELQDVRNENIWHERMSRL